MIGSEKRRMRSIPDYCTIIWTSLQVRKQGGRGKQGESREKLQKKLDRYKSLCYTLSCSECFGGIAQLGERLTDSQEVSGSIPLISTRKSPEILRFQDSFFAFALFDQGYRLASPQKYLTPCPGNCGMIRPARYRVRKSRAAEREGEMRGRQGERLSFVAIFVVS